MVTDEMFEELNAESTEVMVIDVAAEMGGWYYYEQYVSDHRPVAMSMEILPMSVENPQSATVKTLEGIYDLLGRECLYSQGQILIYRYSDGSCERRISFSASQPE